ncbi:MAG: sulfur carrier protein ThiS, partial [Muribaculaceae bacterium]|nr:sulfur carrier protein ThiS [Muribaculaceae bacterium]
MEIKVNGKLMTVNDNTTVTNLVERICTVNLTGSGVAVAVNGAIVSKIDWNSHV